MVPRVFRQYLKTLQSGAHGVLCFIDVSGERFLESYGADGDAGTGDRDAGSGFTFGRDQPAHR